MKKQYLATAACLLALTACSEATQGDTASEAVMAASDSTAMSSMEAATDSPALTAPLPATQPKLAYSYGLAFELPSDDIGELMRRHADLCEQQGPQSCRIVGMELSGDAARDDRRGKLQLAVAANHARAVSALLEREAEGLGAEQTATTIGSEEVSKTIVDTEARIRSREELRDRLSEILRTRSGDMKDLVEAERQVAAVNEEIDQARSWLAETKGRVAFSVLDIDYGPQATAGSDLLAPIAGVLGSLGSVLGVVIAGLLMIGAVLLPIGAIRLGGSKAQASHRGVPVRRLRASMPAFNAPAPGAGGVA